MLGKVLKYDLKYIYKILGVFYLLTFGMAILTRILLGFENSMVMHIIGLISSGTLIALFFNILINNFMRIWVRFRKNIYGDEAYLTHTLPITKQTIYNSKFFALLITTLTSFLVVILSVLIAYFNKENLIIFKDIILSSFRDMTGFNNISLIIILIIILILEVIFMVQIGYTGMILGHKSNQGKIAKSIGIGIGIYYLVSLLSLLLLYIIALFTPNLMDMFISNTFSSPNTFKVILIGCSVYYLLLIIIFYFINIKNLKVGVNLD